MRKTALVIRLSFSLSNSFRFVRAFDREQMTPAFAVDGAAKEEYLMLSYSRPDYVSSETVSSPS